MSIVERFVADQKRQAVQQIEINNLANVLSAVDLQNAIKEIFKGTHSEYPQYDGYWEKREHGLYIIKRDVTTKLGCAFLKGDFAIGYPSKHFHILKNADIPSLDLYSIRNNALTAIRPTFGYKII